MSEIVQFIPQTNQDAANNLAAFVKLCKEKLTVFGKELNWDAIDWDITEFIVIRGRKGRMALVFSTFDTAGPNKNGATPLAQPFLDFAKAFMRYQHAMRPTKDFKKYVAALRALEKILIERSTDGIPHIENVDPDLLNAVTQLIARVMPSSAYYVAKKLETIASFLVANHLVPMRFAWLSPVKKLQTDNNRTGKEAETRRFKKLPSAEAVDALAKAFHIAAEPRDIIVTSTAALLVCSPDRINEVFRLPVNCEYEEVIDGKTVYGLRWWASKGAGPDTKWIIETMVDVAKDAIEKLRRHTEEARNMARWYEKNPGQLYLAKGSEHLRSKEYLLCREINTILGLSSSSAASRWVKEHGLPCFHQPRLHGQLGALPLFYRFKDVEEIVVNMLPRGFPILDAETGLKYSEALIIVPQKFFHSIRVTSRCMFEIFTSDSFNNELGSGEKHNKSSIFSRLRLTGIDGLPFKLNSHMFRHWLNTIAQNAGVSQLHIAKWSGRKNMEQNAAYDHLTGGELIARAQELSKGKLLGPIADFVINSPVSKEEFIKMIFPTAHVTEFGYCIHDWTMAPCGKYRDCLKCTEHVCVKGNKGSIRLRDLLPVAEALLQKACDAEVEKYFGADRWLEHHRENVAILRGHLEILDDPKIPDDTVYQLSGIREFSNVCRAIEARTQLGSPDATALRTVMMNNCPLKINDGYEVS